MTDDYMPTPDEEIEIDALSDVLLEERDKYPRDPHDVDSVSLAIAVFKSDWLAAHDAGVRADALMDARHLAIGTPLFDALTSRAALIRTNGETT
jgi:hypothetical protein